MAWFKWLQIISQHLYHTINFSNWNACFSFNNNIIILCRSEQTRCSSSEAWFWLPLWPSQLQPRVTCKFLQVGRQGQTYIWKALSYVILWLVLIYFWTLIIHSNCFFNVVRQVIWWGIILTHMGGFLREN